MMEWMPHSLNPYWPFIGYTLQVFLLLLFLRALFHKITAPLETSGYVADYQLLPAFAVMPITVIVIGAELFVVVCLLFTELRAAGLVMAAGLLVLYALGMAVNLWRGRTHIECGCGGKPHPLSRGLVCRNLLLVGVILMLLSQPLGAPAGYGAVIASAAGVCLWLMFILFEHLHANRLTMMTANADTY